MHWKPFLLVFQLPVLLLENLDTVEGGKSVIVESEKAEEWAQEIKMLSQEKLEERHKSAISLRENYSSRYSWSSQCQRFKEKL